MQNHNCRVAVAGRYVTTNGSTCLCVCVCMCVCVYVCVCAVCVCVCVCLFVSSYMFMCAGGWVGGWAGVCVCGFGCATCH